MIECLWMSEYWEEQKDRAATKAYDQQTENLVFFEMWYKSLSDDLWH